MTVIAKYYVETELPLKKAAEEIAAEQSTGTWTSISTIDKEDDPVHKLDAWVLSAENNIVEIGFPDELFEPLNVAQYLSVVAGNLFGLGALENVRLLDVTLPDKMIKSHSGPILGIEEARKIINVYERPFVGTIIKPKVGLSPERTAKVAYDAAIGGIDLIKDDETLTNQDFCPLSLRLEEVMNALERAETQTGKKTFYAVNVTCGAEAIVERAETAVQQGANMVMLDVLTAGFDALKTLSKSVKVPVHVHRTMHAALTRNRKHGIAMLPLARLVRLCGGTNLHTGSYKGKMDSEKTENDACRDALRDEWHGLKPVFPVASGGLHPLNVAPNIDGYGIDCIIQAGGGVHGHPDGTTAGAKAMRQAVDAWLEGVTVREYARAHSELQRALQKWG
jgi:ribulose-bisphosphate carboxylase large chain